MSSGLRVSKVTTRRQVLVQAERLAVPVDDLDPAGAPSPGRPRGRRPPRRSRCTTTVDGRGPVEELPQVLRPGEPASAARPGRRPGAARRDRSGGRRTSTSSTASCGARALTPSSSTVTSLTRSRNPRPGTRDRAEVTPADSSRAAAHNRFRPACVLMMGCPLRTTSTTTDWLWVHMSLVRRTSVAAVAVTGLVLALVMTLVASGSPGAAEPGNKKRWVPAVSRRRPRPRRWRSAARRAASGGKARLVTFNDRILGAQPVLSYRGFADPTVAQYAGGWVGVSTGPAAPRAVAPQPGGPWQNIPSALTTLPSWAISGRIWASDLVQVNGQWILYFSAEVAGLGLDGRCIGAATATDPTQTFVPDERPLVCPKQAVAPPAYDKIKRRGRDLPKAGVIDPDYFQDKGGQQYLLYRTQEHALHDPDRAAARQRPARRAAGAEHRAGPPRRRDREPDAGPARAPVRADHLRGRLRRVLVQDDLPPLGAAHRLVEVQAPGAAWTPRRAGCAVRAAPTWAAGRAASRCCSSTPGPAPSSGATARAATTTTASPSTTPGGHVRRACCGSPTASRRGSRRTSPRSRRRRRRPPPTPTPTPTPTETVTAEAQPLSVSSAGQSSASRRRSSELSSDGDGVARGLVAAERLLGDVGLGVDERVVADPPDDALADAGEGLPLDARSRRSSRHPSGPGCRSRRRSCRRWRPRGRCRPRSGRTPRPGRCSRR